MQNIQAPVKLEIPLRDVEADPGPLLDREWLVANGLGGYSSSTISGVITRRYHGLLVAALPTPLGRTVMLNNLIENMTCPDGSVIQLTGEERASCGLKTSGACFLRGFSLEMGLPVWRYQVGEISLEKRIFLRYKQNTLQIDYTLSGSRPVRLSLRPCVHFRAIEGAISSPNEKHHYLAALSGDLYQLSDGQTFPTLSVTLEGTEAQFTAENMMIEELRYRVEETRGFEGRENLWSPGYFNATLSPGTTLSFIASVEPPEVLYALSAKEAGETEARRRQLLVDSAAPESSDEVVARLVLSADQFIIEPYTRKRDNIRIRAIGDEPRSIIAGYHWFTDWGRDTMISLEGLALIPRRYIEAGRILRTYSSYINQGLIPNMFPEREEAGRYNTADATLWFFHAIHRYLRYTGDRATLKFLLPDLVNIIDSHARGTLFGIRLDEKDWLLTQGQEDYALTWMDAKVGDWVVTPRRGKAVEINALWYNALCLLAGWLKEAGDVDEARRLQLMANEAKQSFNRRFWYHEGGYLFDVLDGPRGDDISCRPNQILAISLTYPILDKARWEPVLSTVKQRLLTPFGFRSLAPGHPDYKPRYYGDLRARDAAYHQGTVWSWLIGPFVDAWLKLYPRDCAGARAFLMPLLENLNHAGVGYISEIFDAEAPYTPRGCIAQAWSVAELLRAWVKTMVPPSRRMMEEPEDEQQPLGL